MMNAAQSNAGLASMGPMLAKMGRYEDTQIAHVAPGEVVVPRQLMESNPELRSEVMNAFKEVGVDPAQFIVGGDVVMKNPITGIQEFGLWGKLKKVVKKLAPILVPVAMSFVPALAGLSATKFGAISGGLTGAVQGGDLKDILKGALTGGAIGGLTTLGQKAFAGKAPVDAANPAGTTAAATASKSPLVDQAFPDLAVGAPDPSGILGAVSPSELVRAAQAPVGAPASTLSLGMTGADAITAAQTPVGTSVTNTLRTQPNLLARSAQKLAKSFAEPFMPKTFDPLKAAGYASIAGSMLVEEPKIEDFDSEAAYQEAMAEYERQVAAVGYGPTPTGFAEGGIANMMNGGFTQGPGTGTSDSIPAYLSDGEFVMTAKAVEGAGKGDPKQGAAKMYAMMDKFERMA